MAALDKLIEAFEKQELEANDTLSAELYAKLLAAYLHKNDLCNAKYLWKRIPYNMKGANTELAQIWTVGQHMWRRDYQATYAALVAVNWSPNVAEVMQNLAEVIREKAIDLISQAYSSVTVDSFIRLTGLSQVEVMELANRQKWKMDGDMIYPCKQTKKIGNDPSSEDQLYKLTEFVSFLEN